MFRRILVRFLFGLLIVGSLGLVVVIGIANFGLVNGEEFAPDTFERRSYWYFELPLVRLKVTPIKRSAHQNSLEQTLVDNNYLTAIIPPKRWDLVTTQRYGQLWREGDALILCHYLDAVDHDDGSASDCYWEQWTNDHSQLAQILWPEVARLARRDLYFLIPPLFEAAVASGSPQQLQNDLDEILARSYEWLAEAEVELKNLDTAVRFYSDALRRDPNRIRCLTGRANCYEALGKPVEALSDRRRVAPAEAEK